MKQILLLGAMVTGLLAVHSSCVFAQEEANKQKLKRMISLEMEEIEKSPRKKPRWISVGMTQEEWQRLAADKLKKLENLRSLVERTPEEQIPDVLVEHFLGQYQGACSIPLVGKLSDGPGRSND